jgi:dephospho-CoA kinase
MRVIGLTGGIGSGKSTVAKILADLGAEVINADQVGHEVYRPGTSGFAAVVEAFGNEIVGEEGTIDRRKLGAIVFGNAAALARLNAIVHPLISDTIRRRIDARRAEGSQTCIVVEAALLIEANWLPLVDEVWVVVASPAAVVERLHAERGLPAAQVEARVKAQLGDDARRQHASTVIENIGTVDVLRDRVRELWTESGSS